MINQTAPPTALSAALGLSLLLPNLEGAQVLAAFCGAALLVMSREQISPLKAISLFVIAFLMGVLFADFGTTVISFFLPVSLGEKMPLSLGALLVSMLITQGALLLLKQDLATILSIIKHKEINKNDNCS